MPDIAQQSNRFQQLQEVVTALVAAIFAVLAAYEAFKLAVNRMKAQPPKKEVQGGGAEPRNPILS